MIELVQTDSPGPVATAATAQELLVRDEDGAEAGQWRTTWCREMVVGDYMAVSQNTAFPKSFNITYCSYGIE